MLITPVVEFEFEVPVVEFEIPVVEPVIAFVEPVVAVVEPVVPVVETVVPVVEPVVPVVEFDVPVWAFTDVKNRKRTQQTKPEREVIIPRCILKWIFLSKNKNDFYFLFLF